MDYQTLISQVLMIVAFITIIVNIITEVAKSVSTTISGSKYINKFVLVVSVVLTVIVLLAYWQIKNMIITWYLIVAFIIIGILVAYAAMFGYDKLLSYFKTN